MEWVYLVAGLILGQLWNFFFEKSLGRWRDRRDEKRQKEKLSRREFVDDQNQRMSTNSTLLTAWLASQAGSTVLGTSLFGILGLLMFFSPAGNYLAVPVWLAAGVFMLFHVGLLVDRIGRIHGLAETASLESVRPGQLEPPEPSVQLEERESSDQPERPSEH